MNVESLFFFTDKFDEFFRFWNSLEKGGCPKAPSKSKLNPQDFKEFLDQVALFEIKGPTTALVRLTGTSLDKVLGRNITGQNMYDYFYDQDFDTYKEVQEIIINKGYGVMSIREVVSADGQAQILRSIGLPLCDDTNKLTYVLAFYEFDNQPKANLLNEYSPFENFENFSFKLIDLETGNLIH